MAGLSLKNVSKAARRESPAVEDFNLEIEDKEFIVLGGLSGSRKSAILRLIAGLDSLSSGEIYMDSNRIDHLPMRRREIALVSHDRKLNGLQTVRKIILAGTKGLGLSATDANARVQAAAETLEIADMLDQKPKALSEGAKQRVAFARALVQQPKVLLMDDPFVGLDLPTRSRLRTRISRLHRQLQATFVLVTGDYREAMSMGTRIIVLREGKIQQSDTPQNLYDFPENLYVAEFVGQPEMNLLRSRLEVVGSEGVFASFGENRIKIPSGKLQRFTSDSYIGKEVYLGIRPENLHDEDAFLAVSEESTLEMTVEHVELLGSETHLYLSADGVDQSIVARVSPRSMANPGDRIAIAFDTNRLHFFDVETEKTILMRI